MNLLQNYSSKLLCKIDKPSILEKFYPVPEKYITLNVAGAMAAKTYDYWNVVLEFIQPILAAQKISIIQLGDQNEPVLKGVIRLAGQTDIHQSAYIVHNALLHVGTDSFLVHLAGGFNTPFVGLFSVSPPSICSSPFGNKNKQINIEPNFKENCSYSYNPAENPKNINSIKPEQIVRAIGKLLNIDFPKFETVFLGSRFNQISNEIIPNCIVPNEYFPGAALSIRLDLTDFTQENLNFTYQQLFNRQCSIRTGKEIDLNLIIQNPRMKQNLAGILLDLTDDGFSESYVKSLIDNQIKFILAYGGESDNPDNEDQLKKLKLKFCEYGIIQKFQKNTKELKDILDAPDFSPDKVFVRSNHVLINNGQIFSSQTSMEDKLSVEQTQNLEFSLKSLRNWKNLAQDGDFLFVYRQLSA